jgi:hypothetical protein
MIQSVHFRNFKVRNLVQRNPWWSSLRRLKLAVLSESQADEAAVRLFVEAILQIQTQPIGLPPLRSRGWPSVLHRVFQCH